MYPLLVLADLPKNHWPFIISCMTIFAIPILMISLFVVLLVVVGICPLPDWSAFAVEWSSNLAGTMPGARIEGRSIGLVREVPTGQKQMIGVLPKQGIVVSQMDMVAYPTFDSGHMVVVVCTHNDMARMSMEVEVSMQAH
jgi:hypothetical protein